MKKTNFYYFLKRALPVLDKKDCRNSQLAKLI